jgi:predicted  nucleic acid-binding Zn-ribbon protein
LIGILSDLELFLGDLKRYQINKYLYKIDGYDYEELMSFMLTQETMKNSEIKDVLKRIIFEKLNLSKLDTIFFLDDCIYIKLFLHVTQKEAQERRACGISPDILEEYKQRYFKNEDYKELSLWLLDFVIEDNLSFKKLNPYEFKNFFISVFINMMELIVLENTDLDDEKTIKGLSLYLLREMFDEFLLNIAEDILFHFSNQDKKAIEFLSYFSVNETIDANGIRHKAIPILDENNRAWNITTIKSVMIQHKRSKQTIYDKKNLIVGIKHKIDDHLVEMLNFENQKKDKEKELDELENKLQTLKENMQKVQNASSKKVMYKDGENEKIYDKNQLISKLYRQEDELLIRKKLITKELKEIDIKISNKQKDIAIWEKKLKESEESLEKIKTKEHPIDIQYDKIKMALAKALAKR